MPDKHEPASLSPGIAPDDEWIPANRRRAIRHQVDKLTHALKSDRLILDRDKKIAVTCKIMDCSATGFRIAIKDIRSLELGQEVIVEHADKTRRFCVVRWSRGSQAGLEITPPPVWLFLDEAEKDRHKCVLLPNPSLGFRVELLTDLPLRTGGKVGLLTPDDKMHQLTVSWIFGREVGLKPR